MRRTRAILRFAGLARGTRNFQSKFPQGGPDVIRRGPKYKKQGAMDNAAFRGIVRASSRGMASLRVAMLFQADVKRLSMMSFHIHVIIRHGYPLMGEAMPRPPVNF